MAVHDGASEAQSEMIALFVSDVHLQAQMPATTAAFLDFLSRHGRHAQQLYLLGDLFEYWAGDDDIDAPFNHRIVAALKSVSEAGTRLFWIAGNRDFLVGKGFGAAIGATLLQDGTVIDIAGQRIVLAHGDALCTDDVDYIKFRDQVRQPAWQQQFLAMPLRQRKALIDNLRVQSRAAVEGKHGGIMDVNPIAVAALFGQHATRLMIHGHTHRPATHVTTNAGEEALIRYVLPDWDCETTPPRGGWLGISEAGEICRFGLADLR